MTEEEKRTQAWVGDAVLALFARQWLVGRCNVTLKQRAELFARMTSNHFLASVGEPTAVEAQIGIIYQSDGLDAAFAHIEATLVPLFEKQEARAKQPGSYRDK